MDDIEVYELKQFKRLYQREMGKQRILEEHAEIYRTNRDERLIDLLNKAGIKHEWKKQSEKVGNIEIEITLRESKNESDKWERKTGKRIRTIINGA